MLQLRRLTIHQFRAVAPGSELRFDAGINFILGQNAAGKTTLLALISVVCRSAFDGLRDEEFALAYELHSGRYAVTVEVSHRRAETTGDIAGDAFVDAIQSGAIWDDRYAVRCVDSETGDALALTSDDATTGRKKIDMIMGWSFVAALLSNRPSWSELRAELLATFAHAFRFDESLGAFAAMTGRETPLLEALHGPAVPGPARAEWTETRAPNGRVSVTSGGFVPSDLAHALQRSFARRAGPTATLDDAARPLAEKLARLLGVKSVAIAPNVQESRVTADRSSFSVRGFTFTITRGDGTSIHHDRLSYGQKRLISFLYYLECNPHVVIADELVNGLHHRWIDACMQELGERQAFLTSQNPLLFDHATFDSIEQICARFVICHLEPGDDGEQMVWRNMSLEDARTFFEAYSAGIEHVGDILITRGLW